MEGQVYLCSWEKIGERYRVWWIERPTIAAEGDSFDEADEALYEAMMDAAGDGENQHEYEPPAPRLGGRSGSPYDLVLVGGGETGWVESVDGLFVDGLCAECNKPSSPRTSALLSVGKEMQMGPRNIGAIWRRRATFTGPRMSYVSAAFRALLTDEEDASLEYRDVIGPPGSREKLFEIIRGKTEIPLVQPVGTKPHGWVCETCGFETTPFVLRPENGGAHWNVGASSLPPLLPGIFLVGKSPEWHVGLTRARWRAMIKEAGARGCKSDDLDVLDDADVDRAPALKAFRK